MPVQFPASVMSNARNARQESRFGEMRQNAHMRVLALVPQIFNTSPGQRYRIEQWAPIMRRAGIEIEFAPFECPRLHAVIYQPGMIGRKVGLILRGFLRRAADMRRAAGFDAVYLFREAALLGPAVFERWLKAKNKPIVFDFDDAIFVRYVSPANGYLSYLKFPGKTGKICRMASHVMAGNDFLAAYARRYNSGVTVVPTTMDLEKYTLEERRTFDIPMIGWTGSYSSLQYLRNLHGVLREVYSRVPFHLRVIGPGSPDLAGLPVEFIPWRAESEVADLRPIDVGLMPVPDNPWNRGKCACKALQYMALAIPAICSPVGVNAQIIRDGENGFLADKESEWIEKLIRLLRSEKLRRKLGAAGRKTVEERFSAEVAARTVCEVFRSLS